MSHSPHRSFQPYRFCANLIWRDGSFNWPILLQEYWDRGLARVGISEAVPGVEEGGSGGDGEGGHHFQPRHCRFHFRPPLRGSLYILAWRRLKEIYEVFQTRKCDFSSKAKEKEKASLVMLSPPPTPTCSKTSWFSLPRYYLWTEFWLLLTLGCSKVIVMNIAYTCTMQWISCMYPGIDGIYFGDLFVPLKRVADPHPHWSAWFWSPGSATGIRYVKISDEIWIINTIIDIMWKKYKKFQTFCCF